MRKFLMAAVLVGAATGFAQAADPIMDPPVIEAAPMFDWSGFYIGASVGAQQVNVVSGPGFVQPSGMGFTGGVFLGGNMQIDNFVLGAEGDLEYSSFSASALCGNPAWTCTTNLNAQGSVRGRIGIAADRALLYVTGGLAAANFGGNTRLGAGVPFTDGSTRIGWTLGAGIDMAVTETVFVRGQYRYSNYGTRTMNYDVPYPNVGVSTHQFTLGVGALFN